MTEEFQQPVDAYIQALKGYWVPPYIDSIPNDGVGLEDCRRYVLPSADHLIVRLARTMQGADYVAIERVNTSPLETILAATEMYRAWQVDLGEWNFLLQGGGEYFNRWRVHLDQTLQSIDTVSWTRDFSFDIDGADDMDTPMPGVQVNSIVSHRLNSVSIDVPYGQMQGGIFPDQLNASLRPEGLVVSHGIQQLFAYGFYENNQPYIAALAQGVTPDHASAWIGYINKAVDAAMGAHIPLAQPLESYRAQLLGVVQQQMLA